MVWCRIWTFPHRALLSIWCALVKKAFLHQWHRRLSLINMYHTILLLTVLIVCSCSSPVPQLWPRRWAQFYFPWCRDMTEEFVTHGVNLCGILQHHNYSSIMITTDKTHETNKLERSIQTICLMTYSRRAFTRQYTKGSRSNICMAISLHMERLR